jgi:hypothetical protein
MVAELSAKLEPVMFWVAVPLSRSVVVIPLSRLATRSGAPYPLMGCAVSGVLFLHVTTAGGETEAYTSCLEMKAGIQEFVVR